MAESTILRKLCLIAIFLMSLPVFAQSTIDEDTIHFVGQASAFTVGAELIANGTFTGAATGWTVGTWTYAANAISEDNAGGDSDLTQNITSLTDGAIYRIQFEVTVYTDGNVAAVFDGVELGDKSSTGVYTGYAVATGTDADVDIRADATFTGTIDNVSVVAWVGHLTPGGGCPIADFSGTLTDYMTATGGVLAEGTTKAVESGGSGKVKVTDVGAFADIGPGTGAANSLHVLLNNFSDAGGVSYTDGVYECYIQNDDILFIEGLTYDDDETCDYWLGGAFPDIETAVASGSTLTEDPDAKYRKRSICVNVDNVVDAVVDFVAETSEAAVREDDASRKIIGFYDSISVVQPDAGYRVVSDMDVDGTYYGGARKAFNEDESFPTIRPNGKWIEWNANGNDISIVELNTSNFEMRNIKAHNNTGGAGTEGVIHIDDATIYNITLTNCWFATMNDFIRNDEKSYANSVVDCFFQDDIADVSLVDFGTAYFEGCIFDGTGRADNINNFLGGVLQGCLVYKGGDGVHITSVGPMSNICIINTLFIDQTASCVDVAGTGRVLATYSNNIFSPVAAADYAIDITNGSITAAGFNNIMYSTTAAVVLTSPINHDQITPNPPLPVGTLEVDPLFVNPAIGDYRLQSQSPALNAGRTTLFGGTSTIGPWLPSAITSSQSYRPRYNDTGIYR